MTPQQTLIEELKKSKLEEDRKKCIPLLQDYLKNNSQDLNAWYDLACCFDFCGFEREAEPCYRKTYELGWQNLPSKEQPGFLLGFGSTLRNNFDFVNSEKILREGTLAFPDYPALKVFLAFTLHTQGKFRETSEELFAATLQMPEKSFDGYERAVKWYVENLETHPIAVPKTLFEIDGVRIRSARPEDAAEIANVHLNTWREAYKGQLDQQFLDDMPLTFKQRKKNWEQRLANHVDSVFVAESKHGIVGFISVEAPAREEGMKDWGEVGAVYLLEKFKGKKIGLHLLKAGFSAIKSKGFNKAYCWMLKGNATGKFYESTGAKLSGKEKIGPVNGKDEVDVMYVWDDLGV